MNKQCGNVLFLILIAVALFAALSYAVTSSSKGGGSGIAKDKAKILAAQFVQYGMVREQALTRMTLNGVPEYGFDLSSNITYPSVTNATCTNNECKLFHINGGGISASYLDESAFDKSLTGANSPTIFKKNIFRAIQVLDVGSDLDDLVMQIHLIDKNVSIEINRAMGINDGGSPPTDSPPGQAEYSGTLSAFPISGTGVIGDEAAIFKGQRTFCTYHNATWGYTYYHVLIAR